LFFDGEFTSWKRTWISKRAYWQRDDTVSKRKMLQMCDNMYDCNGTFDDRA